MRLCDKCIELFRDAGFIVTPEPLAYGEYTYMKCENCKKSRYANKVKVTTKKKANSNPDFKEELL